MSIMLYRLVLYYGNGAEFHVRVFHKQAHGHVSLEVFLCEL